MFEKFKGNEDYIEVFDKYKKLNERTKEVIEKKFLDDLEYQLYKLEETKSPIEEILASALHQELYNYIHFVDMDLQYKLKADGNNYVIDMVLAFYNNDIRSGVLVAIECDGHEFHEKTKEQAANDRKRERAITREGYTVIRFTGSEIYNNPQMCAHEVKSFVRSYFSNITKKMNGNIN